MSYDITLSDENGVVPVERHFDGGTRALGGTPYADLNVTFNYRKHFDFNLLHEAIASDVEPIMADAVATLGTERDEDYWAPTPGNTGYALSILLGWARQHPDATFEVSK